MSIFRVKALPLRKIKKNWKKISGEPEKNLAEIEAEIKKLRKSIEKNEQRIVAPEKSDGDGSEKKLAEVRESRVKIQYELGRLQGMIELEERKRRIWQKKYLKKRFRKER